MENDHINPAIYYSETASQALSGLITNLKRLFERLEMSAIEQKRRLNEFYLPMNSQKYGELFNRESIDISTAEKEYQKLFTAINNAYNAIKETVTTNYFDISTQSYELESSGLYLNVKTPEQFKMILENYRKQI